MTLRYMQGFETVMTNADIRSQGWNTGLSDPMCPPATRGQTGKTFHITNRPNSTGVALYPGGAGGIGTATDIFYNTGVTLNSLWTSGGFAVGFAAKMNSSTDVINPRVMGLVGSLSWRQLAYAGGGRWLVTGTDAGSAGVYYADNNGPWSLLPSQPGSVASFTLSSVTVGGTTRVYCGNSTAVAYYTDDGGATWNPTNVGVATAIGAVTVSSFYYINGQYWAYSSASSTAPIRVSEDGINSWSSITVASTNIVVTDLIYFNGKYIAATTASSTYISTTGASGGGEWTNTPLGITGNIRRFMTNGTILLAVMSTGVIAYSSDGTTWATTSIPGFVPTLSTIAYGNGLFVVAGTTPSGWTFATSTDGISWTVNPNYYTTRTSGVLQGAVMFDNNEFVSAGYSVLRSTDGFMWSTSFAPESSGAIQSAVNYSLTGIFVAPPTASNAATFAAPSQIGVVPTTDGKNGSINFKMQLQANYTTATADSTTSTNTFVLTDLSSPWHYYELIFTPTAVSNQFIITVVVDGVVRYTSAAFQVAPTNNLTACVCLMYGKQGAFSEFDDMYFLDTTGTTNNAAFGDVTIQVMRPTTDVTAQLTKYPPTAASNAAAVRADSLSQAAGYVEGAVNGTYDEYSSTDIASPVYNVKAVQVEGYFNKTTAASPVMKLGVVSGSSAADTGNLSVSQLTPTYVSKIVEQDPNGNVQWTTSSVQNSHIRIDKVS